MGKDHRLIIYREQNMAEWLKKNLSVAITTTTISCGIVASWAVAQYQIRDLRENYISILTKMDTMPPADTKRRIELIERQLSDITAGQTRIQIDLGVALSILTELRQDKHSVAKE